MGLIKCEHSIIILSTKKQPHIRACTKCYIYSPRPHPDLTEKEIVILIKFVKSISGEFPKKNIPLTDAQELL